MSKTAKQRVEDNFKKHPEWSMARRSNSLGMKYTMIQKYIPKGVAVNPALLVQKSAVRKITEFREQYDKSYIVPKRVKEQLRLMGNGWMYENDFAKNAGVSLSDLANFRDMFAENIVVLKEGRRAWAGSTKAAQEMRSML